MIDGDYDTQGWNRYSYCKGNPIQYKDPTGHKSGYGRRVDEKKRRDRERRRHARSHASGGENGGSGSESKSNSGSDASSDSNNKKDPAVKDKVENEMQKAKGAETRAGGASEKMPEWVTGKESRNLYNFLSENKLAKTMDLINKSYQATKEDEYHLPHGSFDVTKIKFDKEEMKKLKPFLKNEWKNIQDHKYDSTGDYYRSITTDGKPEVRFNGVHFQYNTKSDEYTQVHYDMHDPSRGTGDAINHLVVDKWKVERSIGEFRKEINQWWDK